MGKSSYEIMKDDNIPHDDATLFMQVLDVVRGIPVGRVLSYGAVGASCEPPISGYVCGRVLQNVPDDVPWWRVVGKQGNLPISKRHPELSLRQRALLEAEGVRFDDKGQVLMAEFAQEQPRL